MKLLLLGLREFHLTLLLLLLLMGAARAADYTAETYTDSSGGGTMPYELLVPPGYQASGKYPVILFFHGAGERGSDNKSQLVHIATIFADPAFQSGHPCFVIAPQCPTNQGWVDMNWSALSGVRPPQPSKAMAQALKILDQVEAQYSINKDQVYVCGLSMGGYAVWDCITRFPQRFAAGLASCGGGDETTVTPEVAQVPVWAFHSSDDPIVPVVRSRNMVAAMIKAGGHTRYTEYNWVGHYSWEDGFRQAGLFDWLFGQRLSTRPPAAPPPSAPANPSTH